MNEESWVPQSYDVASASPFQPWSPYPDVGMGPVVQMMMPMLANHLHGQYGTNLGMFQQGNLYNNLQQQAFLTSHNFLMQQAASRDRVAARDLIRGAGSMFGVQWTPENEQRADALAAAHAHTFGPALLQSDLGAKIYNDTLGGRSQAVLFKYMHQAGRYRNDPIDSGSTVSGFSADEISARLFRDLYDAPGVPGGQDVWRQRMAGLDTYESGQLLLHMQARGQLGRNTDFSGLTGDENTDRGLLAGRETESIKRSLLARVDSIKALKELFGEAGNPNAPLPQLMNALESLAGGAHQIEGNRISQIVRNLGNAAKDVGLNINTAGMMVEQTGNRFAAMGLNPAFAGLAVTGQLNVLNAMGRIGLHDAANPAWGLSSEQELMAQYGRRYAGAMRSEVGNLFNTILRLGDNTDAYTLDTTTAEGRLIAQARQEHKDGRYGAAAEQLRKLDRQSKINLLQQGYGLTASQAVAQLEESVFANDEYGHKYGTADRVAMYGQKQDLFETIGSSLSSSSIYSILQERSGGRIQNMDEVSRRLSGASLRALGDMSSVDLKNVARRRDRMAQAMRAEAMAEGGELASLVRQNPQLLRQIADQQFNMLDSEYQRRTGGKHVLDFLALSSPDALAEMARVAERQNLRSEMQRDVTGLAEDSPMQRFLQSVMQKGFDPNSTDISKSLANTLGVSNSAATQALAVSLSGLAKKERELQAEWDRIDREMPGDAEARKNALRQRMQGITEEYKKQMSILNENPEMKKLYEQWQEQLKQEAEGAKDSQVTLNIGELNINGTVIKDAKGNAKALAKTSQGRGQGTV